MIRLLFVAAVALLPLTSMADIKGYSCLGTEPFFGLQISGSTLTYERVGEQPDSFKVEGPLSATGFQDGYVSVYKSVEKDAVVTMVNNTCRDGMSENEYAYTMVFVRGSEVLSGCCEPLAQD